MRGEKSGLPCPDSQPDMYKILFSLQQQRLQIIPYPGLLLAICWPCKKMGILTLLQEAL